MNTSLSNLSHLPAKEKHALLKEYQFSISKTMLQALNNSSKAIHRQFIPDIRELNISKKELSDPIGDEPYSPLPYLVHRYKNRVLWKIAPTCAVYCRFCFRKNHIGRHGKHPTKENILAAQDYIQKHKEIEEVVLSGGDPMTLSAQRLNTFLEPLANITHILRIRVHTRIPVVAPEMVDDDYLQTLINTKKALTFVLHINHVDEFNPKSDSILQQLSKHALLLSQTVLLKNINDNIATLKTLTDQLLARKIHPYYLHHLDLARGTNHFRLSIDEGKTLYTELRRTVSGIALPTYIVELPGGDGKVPMMQLTEKQRNILQQAGIN